MNSAVHLPKLPHAHPFLGDQIIFYLHEVGLNDTWKTLNTDNGSPAAFVKIKKTEEYQENMD